MPHSPADLGVAYEKRWAQSRFVHSTACRPSGGASNLRWKRCLHRLVHRLYDWLTLTCIVDSICRFRQGFLRFLRYQGHHRRQQQISSSALAHWKCSVLLYHYIKAIFKKELNSHGIAVFKLICAFRLICCRFLEMEPIIFHVSDGKGASIRRYIWTNIPDQNFKPNLSDIFEPNCSPGSLLSRREPFLQKYPWIAEDLDAIHQPIPANYFSRRAKDDSLKFRRERI